MWPGCKLLTQRKNYPQQHLTDVQHQLQTVHYLSPGEKKWQEQHKRDLEQFCCISTSGKMFPQADEWVTHWSLRVSVARQENVIWKGWAEAENHLWPREALNAARTTRIMEQQLLYPCFPSAVSPNLYCAVLGTLNNCSTCSKFLAALFYLLQQAAFLPSHHHRYHPVQALFPSLGSLLWTHTNWFFFFLAPSGLIGMVIYSLS